MTDIRCKYCGGTNQIESFWREYECEYCFRMVELDEDRSRFADQYRRAEDAWERKDFDEALAMYEAIIEEDVTQAEAHWTAALCRYGVAYVQDPIRGDKLPTCNRINRTSILEDKNYLAALKYGGKNALEFRRLAGEIDRISREYLKVVDQEKPYDVFISYKRSDANGRRTRDSEMAKMLYLYLRDKGLKVFFAEETLRSVAGTMFEPYIFAALTSSKVMVLYGSSKENIQATWVKNEWRRFLQLQKEDPAKALIPVVVDGDPYDILPVEFSGMQAMNAGSPVFLEEMLDIIRKKLDIAAKGGPKKGVDLQERYAPQAKVDKVVNWLDCDPEFAIAALQVCQGNVDKTVKYISEDPDYMRKRWICSECGATNAHDACRSCGVSKKDSEALSRKREELERKRKKNSAAAKAKRADRTKKILKFLLFSILIVGVLVGVVSCISALVKNNANVDDLYTPEILQTYSGTYRTSSLEGVMILTFSECSDSGDLTGVMEFVADGTYGKYNITGKITAKKANGTLKVTVTAGEWIVHPSNFTPLDEYTLSFNDERTEATSNSYSIKLSSGADSEFSLNTAADLNKLNNADGFFMLGADIDLEGKDWTPIQNFTGTLMGNGHTISNLTIESDSGNVGLFATISGYVSNLKLDNVSITVSGRQENVGALCGSLTGVVSNITANGTVTADMGSNVGGVIGKLQCGSSGSLSQITSDVTVNGFSSVGGIIGSVYYDGYGAEVSMSDLHNQGTVSGDDERVGGIVGSVEGEYLKSYISNCSNTGSVKGKYYVGGISGYQLVRMESYIQDCSCEAAIEAEAFVGCIAGRGGNAYIKSCSNAGSSLKATKYLLDDDGTKMACVGGFMGSGNVVLNCVNEVPIEYTAGGWYVGGILGYCNNNYNDYAMSGLENRENITGGQYTGGILGYWINTSYGCEAQFFDMKNSGQIQGDDYTGGIIGHLYGEYATFKISDLENTGSVTGGIYTGGNIAYMWGKSGSVIQDCSCSADISGEAYVGCIAGYARRTHLDNCVNSGSTLKASKYVTEDGEKYAYVGGFVGRGGYATNCTNEVDIHYTSSGKCVGGIMGYAQMDSGTITHSDLVNNADISGSAYVGGIYGKCVNDGGYSTTTIQFSEIENHGKITGSGNYVGGIVGSIGGSGQQLYLDTLTNTGNIKGGSYVGGICGYAKGKNGSISNYESTGSISGSSKYGKVCGSYVDITIE